MIWDKDNLPDIIVNGKTSAEESQAPCGGVKQQEKDENSLLSFYKRIIKIKNQNPEIARGEITELKTGDDEIVGYYTEYKGKKIYVVHNLNGSEEKIVRLPEKLRLRGDLVASNTKDTENHPELNEKNLLLPPFSTAVLKK